MRERFPVIQGQVEVEYVEMIHRSRRAVVFEIGTRQKYPQVASYSGTELHLMPSEDTRPDSYDPAVRMTTSVMFPARYKGWEVLPEFRGRYTLRVALYRLGRRSGELMEEHSADWRIKRITRRG